MQYLLVQCGLTVLFTLLRWTFIWTKTVENNFSWPIVNNLFFVIVLSWLFTLGYFVKHRMEESLRGQLDRERKNVRNSQSNYQYMEKELTVKIKELLKERERFFVLVEKMVVAASLGKSLFHADQSDVAVIEKEKSVMSNFVF